MRPYAALMAACLALAGCQTTSGGKGVMASLGGGAAGQKSTSQMVDAMDGGLIGGAIGKGLNASETRRALAAEYKALEYAQSGEIVSWKGDTGSRSGNVVPGQPYRVGSQDCRQYTHTVTIDGASQTARGTACRNADGSWTTLS